MLGLAGFCGTLKFLTTISVEFSNFETPYQNEKTGCLNSKNTGCWQFIKCLAKGAQPGAPRSPREQPGATRSTPGGPRSSQEQPGAARSPQEQPGAARSRQEQPGAASSSQQPPEPPGAARSSQEAPGARRSRQEQPGAPQEPPGADRSSQEPPGALRSLARVHWITKKGLPKIQKEADRLILLWPREKSMRGTWSLGARTGPLPATTPQAMLALERPVIDI